MAVDILLATFGMLVFVKGVGALLEVGGGGCGGEWRLCVRDWSW